MKTASSSYRAIIVMLSIAAVVGIAAGCHSMGYSLGSTLPSDIKTIHVPTFVNKTGEPQIESTLTRATIQDFQREGNLRITDANSADLILKVKVIGYDAKPIRYDKDDPKQTNEYRLTIRAQIDVTRRKTGDLFLPPQVVSGYEVFAMVGDMSSSKLQALPEAADSLAKAIVERVVEYWQ